MNNLWKKEFKSQAVETPKEIIEKQCEFLSQQTSGDIIAKILEYDGKVESYTEKGITSINFNFVDKSHNIQEDLGEINESNFTFEFFITSKNTPNYKYRVFFLQYGIAFYPTKVVLDESIAQELQINTTFECPTKEDFEISLGKILNSNKLETVINSLLSITRKEDFKYLQNL